MYDSYRDGLSALLAYREFQVVYAGLRYSLLLVIALLLVVALLHIVYLLGFNSPLYSRRSPARGWNRKFSLALIVMIALTASVYWFLSYQQQTIS